MKRWAELADGAKGKRLGICAIACGVALPPLGVMLGVCALVYAVKAIDQPGASGNAKPGVVCGLLGLFIGLKMSLLEALLLLG